eukprot:CAMPEP_0113931960 /NCGR_PEP_ID=MMETSP1159-20121227/6838_1 /TAXON_ID=88271 /ORGANISM="Picocystis salinarum" /LENGTH=153 /DNA_ID=CAMNT_0000932997 /DNA_START=17 /DNA_END=475 /DNA_ORIENTATION=+ /assembly_acc=CAM_ASM_000767
MEFNPTPYRGDPSIPHVNEELFKVILVGVNVATAWTMGSGRITTLGSEVQPRRFLTLGSEVQPRRITTLGSEVQPRRITTLGSEVQPRRITTLGSEVQPRRFFPDYLLAVCDENARKREMKNGKVPRWFVPHPNPTNKSLPKMWDNFLNRKRW